MEEVSGFDESAPRQDAQTRHNPPKSMQSDSLPPRPRPSFTGEQVSKADSQDAPRQNAESRHDPGKKEPSLPLQVSTARRETTADRYAFMARMKGDLTTTCYLDEHKTSSPKTILQPKWGRRAEEHSKSVNPHDITAHVDVAHMMAARLMGGATGSSKLCMRARVDINWKSELAVNKNAVEHSYQKEMESLTKSILTRVTPEDDDWERSQRESTRGRALLDEKRNSTMKTRIVKQGFREDHAFADGPDFNYYSNVASLESIRASLFRHRRADRRIAIQDISTAFLQSRPYGPGIYKYLHFKNPITGEVEYYRQSGPIYGESSAPTRWEETLAEFLTSTEMGFVRSKNEPSTYYHPERDILIITYVDDLWYDGSHGDISWATSQIAERFDCKDIEWLTPGKPLDYLGMDIIQDDVRTYINMSSYITTMLERLDLPDNYGCYYIPPHARDKTKKHRTYHKPVKVPMRNAIDEDSPLLSPFQRTRFLAIMGCIGWCAITARAEVKHTHSRISRYMAAPNESAMEHAEHCLAYLSSTRRWSLSAKLWDDDPIYYDIMPGGEKVAVLQYGWTFYSDSDFAGNAEVNNKRKSQTGYLARCGEGLVMFYSKTSSTAFACPAIGESHVSTSVGEAETYAVGNAAKSIMSLQYNSEEMGLPFPKRIICQVDSDTAKSFSNNSCKKSKLKHIDCRQEWVQVLRDKNILKCVHVPGTENLADLFTKILDPGDFIRQRDTIMVECPHVLQPYADMAREDPSDIPDYPSDIPETIHSPAMVPLVNHVAKMFCDEEDYSIRVSPVVIPSPNCVPTIVPVMIPSPISAPTSVPSPKRVQSFKKRVQILHSVSNIFL